MRRLGGWLREGRIRPPEACDATFLPPAVGLPAEGVGSAAFLGDVPGR